MKLSKTIDFFEKDKTQSVLKNKYSIVVGNAETATLKFF
jgi:hypothetical protein